MSETDVMEVLPSLSAVALTVTWQRNEGDAFYDPPKVLSSKHDTVQHKIATQRRKMYQSAQMDRVFMKCDFFFVSTQTTTRKHNKVTLNEECGFNWGELRKSGYCSSGQCLIHLNESSLLVHIPKVLHEVLTSASTFLGPWACTLVLI